MAKRFLTQLCNSLSRINEFRASQKSANPPTEDTIPIQPNLAGCPKATKNQLNANNSTDLFNLETAVGADKKAQSFDPEPLDAWGSFTFWECSTPASRDSGSKSCTFLRGPTAISRFKALTFFSWSIIALF